MYTATAVYLRSCRHLFIFWNLHLSKYLPQEKERSEETHFTIVFSSLPARWRKQNNKITKKNKKTENVLPLSCNRFYLFIFFLDESCFSLSRGEKKKKKIFSKNLWREDQSSHALITYENERNKMYSSVQGAVSCLAVVCVVLAAAAFIFPGDPLRLLDLCTTLPDMCNI